MRSVRRAVGLVLGVALGACGGPQDPAGAGEDCYRDADCEPGLVCVADAEGVRKCSNDLTNLDSQVEAPPAPEMPPVEGEMPPPEGEMPPAEGT